MSSKFGDEYLPEFYTQLKAGEDGQIIIEAIGHLSSEIVRERIGVMS